MRTVRIFEELLSTHLRRLPVPYIELLQPLVLRHARQAQALSAQGLLTRRTAVEMAQEACRDIDARIATDEFQQQLRALIDAARPSEASVAKSSSWRRLVVWLRFCIEDVRAFFGAEKHR